MEEIDMIRKENEELKKKLIETEKQLEKYTNNERHKKYYEKNKEKIKENGSNYVYHTKQKNLVKIYI